VVVGEVPMDIWCTWQMKFGLCTVNFLSVESNEAASQEIQKLFEIMMNKSKQEKQRDYFNMLRAEKVSSKTAKQLLRDTFDILQMPSEDIEEILTTNVTIAEFIDAVSRNGLQRFELEFENLAKLFTCEVGVAEI
jgi:hypothetical protein